MTVLCPGCGEPASDRLSVRYRYPRASAEPGAWDPCHVVGAAPLRTCGSVSCQAEGLLAVIERVIADAAVLSGHLLAPEDVRIVQAAAPGEDFTWATCDSDEAS